MRGIKLTLLHRKLAGYFLIILFCGYFGSITFFPHTHKFAGIVISHSHPYKSNPGNDPVNHSHSKNGFILIQFISGFITTAPVIFFGIVVTQNLLVKLFFKHDIIPVLRFNLTSARPRAPTA